VKRPDPPPTARPREREDLPPEPVEDADPWEGVPDVLLDPLPDDEDE
jgi:hypothetical protein